MIQTKIKQDYNYSYVNKSNYGSVKNNSKNNFKIVLSLIVIVFFIGAILATCISQSVTITHLNYQLTGLEEQLVKVEDDNYKLNIKLARDTSLARIEKIARNDLHMVEPKKVEIVVINDEKSIDKNKAAQDNKVFFARVFDNLIQRIGTVKAGEIE